MKELLELFNAMSADERDAFCAKVRKLLGKGKFSESRLRGVVSSGRAFGPVLCVAIETATGGKVTRKMLRPDDHKMYWPDRTNGLVHIREILNRLEIGATPEQIAEARALLEKSIKP